MEYTVIRSSRKTVSLQITPEGEVVVRCPNRMRKEEIRQFVEEHRGWIEKHMPDPEILQQPKYTAQELQAFARQAADILPGRVKHYAAQLGVSFGRITVRAQHTRWGSCSAKGNLNFNCLLALVPRAVLDYVVIHELCHRIEMNHSPKFWKQVEGVMPDYRIHRAWLKENGGSLIGRLPRV